MKGRPVWRTMILVLLMLPLCATGFAGPDSGPEPGAALWFWTETVVDDGAASIDRVVINSPSDPPVLCNRNDVDPSELEPGRGLVVLPVPAYTWSFGSAATAGAMIAAWYDRSFFPDIYLGPTNDGMMPMDNSVWPTWVDNNGDPQNQCPLSATHDGLDGRTTRGHVDDYWDYLGQPGPDPFFGNWIQHHSGDCTGDFMKTNRWSSSRQFNADGATNFFYYANGNQTLAEILEYHNIHHLDGGYGLKLFYESRGYLSDTMYNQYIAGYNGNLLGFTYEQYKAEIDAGRPVMIHVTGHTMVGVGYNDLLSNLIYINDTWDHGTHSMPWGGSYAGLDHSGVTIVHLSVPTLVELTAFTAKGAFNRVLLEWETATEADNAGFHLWRSETGEGPFTRITDELIPAMGGATWGATYDWWDEGLSAGQTYFYKLEDVNFAGDSTLHGPVSARVR